MRLSYLGSFAAAAALMIGNPLRGLFYDRRSYGGQKSSAAKQQRGRLYQGQGKKERARQHIAAGFQPAKVTPRQEGAFPDGPSRQVRRRAELLETKRLHQRGR